MEKTSKPAYALNLIFFCLMVIDGLLNVVTFVIFLSCHMANVYACIHLTRSIFFCSLHSPFDETSKEIF